jgi:hypothetical protein
MCSLLPFLLRNSKNDSHQQSVPRTTTAIGIERPITQSGPNWTWCQATTWGLASANAVLPLNQSYQCYGSTGTEFDSTPAAGMPDFTTVHGVYLYFGNNGGGTFYLDNVRAQ